jgi:TRAP-type C4-dicarboxylate transport system permease large subunit
MAPEMIRRGYSKYLSIGPIMGVGGLVLLATLGQTDVGALLIAGIIPGLVLATMYGLLMGHTMPPFGLLLFVMKGVSPPGTRMRDIYLAGLPFIACVVLLILLVIYIPPLATWLPKVSR